MAHKLNLGQELERVSLVNEVEGYLTEEDWLDEKVYEKELAEIEEGLDYIDIEEELLLIEEEWE